MRISDWSSDVCSSDLANLDELMRSILTLRVFLPLEDVASLVQIKENEIEDELRNTLVSYPEQDLGQKLVHFIFYGRDRKSVVSGKSVSVRVDLGGRRIIKKKKEIK